MSNLSLFLKKNKKTRNNVKYAATKSLCDENGVPVEWELKHITSAEYDRLWAECTLDSGKLDWTKFRERLIVSCVVVPNLDDAELQDSYGVMSAEKLLRAMVDDAAEFSRFYLFVDRMGGYDKIDEKIEEAKN
jgi:hypothetical protein